MENTRMELNLDELELVNGGWDLKSLWNDIRKAIPAEDEKRTRSRSSIPGRSSAAIPGRLSAESRSAA